MKYEQLFKPGTYYIGDPCYAIDNELWSEWCNNVFNNTENPSTWKRFFTFHGHDVGTQSTAYGDGTYDGFSVDSGTIGIVPIQLVINSQDYDLNQLGRIVSFDEPFTVTFDEPGHFKFGDIEIVTDGSDEEEDEDDTWDDTYDEEEEE